MPKNDGCSAPAGSVGVGEGVGDAEVDEGEGDGAASPEDPDEQAASTSTEEAARAVSERRIVLRESGRESRNTLPQPPTMEPIEWHDGCP